MSEKSLSTLDNQLLDGLEFCIAVYDLFDHVAHGPNGLERVRLRRDETAKRLIEELIPIARYVQVRYEASNRFKVRWINGSQSHDAILYFSGDWVHIANHPTEIHLEVTTSVHPNDYLAREQLDREGVTWGPNLIARDMQTREIKGQPYVYTNDEREVELSQQIIDRIREKAEKSYPDGTILLVNCVETGVVREDEWNQAVEVVRAERIVFPFREVVLLGSRQHRFTTLFKHRLIPLPAAPCQSCGHHES